MLNIGKVRNVYKVKFTFSEACAILEIFVNGFP